MISYNQLIKKVKVFCDNHMQIKRFGADFPEQMPNFATKTEEFPIVYMSLVGKRIEENTSYFTVDIWSWDIIQKDRENINTVLSDTDLILTDLYTYFTDGNDLSIDILTVPDITPLNNGLLDYTAGAVMRVEFEIGRYCYENIPFKSETPTETFYIIDENNNIFVDENGNRLVWI
jgi:hypothetical protein